MLNKVCPICNKAVGNSHTLADGLVFCTIECWAMWSDDGQPLECLLDLLPAEVYIHKFDNMYTKTNGYDIRISDDLSYDIFADSLTDAVKQFLIKYWKKTLT